MKFQHYLQADIYSPDTTSWSSLQAKKIVVGSLSAGAKYEVLLTTQRIDYPTDTEFLHAAWSQGLQALSVNYENVFSELKNAEIQVYYEAGSAKKFSLSAKIDAVGEACLSGWLEFQQTATDPIKNPPISFQSGAATVYANTVLPPASTNYAAIQRKMLEL